MIFLENKDLIGEGGKRLVYKMPNDPSKCIKVVCEEKIKQRRKNRKSQLIITPLRTYNSFHREKREIQEFKKIIFNVGYKSLQYIPMFYGKVETNLGQGIVFDFIKGESLSLFLNKNPKKKAQTIAKLTEIKNFFLENNIHFSDWQLDNFIVTKDLLIYAIDGFESNEFIPITKIRYFSKKSINRRFSRFTDRINTL